MKVKKLIDLLKRYDDNLEVKFDAYSEGIIIPISRVTIKSINQRLTILIEE